MIRRFVYDTRLGAVVELGSHVHVTATPTAAYEAAAASYRERADESTGRNLRHAALERADRRVFAHKRYGDENRWTE